MTFAVVATKWSTSGFPSMRPSLLSTGQLMVKERQGKCGHTDVCH